MRELLINILFIELVIFIGVFIISYIHTLYKQLIPISPFEEDEYCEEDDIYLPPEELLDEGFIQDQNNFESRLSDMKEALKAYPSPAVEIITDEYERSTER